MLPILEAKGIKKYFPVIKGLLFSKTTGWVKAVDGVKEEQRADALVEVVALPTESLEIRALGEQFVHRQSVLSGSLESRYCCA